MKTSLRILPMWIALALPLSAFADAATPPPPPIESPLATHVRINGDSINIDAPISLTPEAAEALRHKVLVHCGMSDTASVDRLPWYFHFEYGRALLGAGDAARAVRQIAEAATLNPTSQADKRMYGMWFADYFPYADLALAHAQLGNWPCATDALRLAESQSDVGPRSTTESFVALKKAIKAHAADATSCLKQDVIDPAYDTTSH